MNKVTNAQGFALSAIFWMYTLLRLLHLSYGKTLIVLFGAAVFGCCVGSRARRAALAGAFWPLATTAVFLVVCWMTTNGMIRSTDTDGDPYYKGILTSIFALAAFGPVFDTARVHRLRAWFPAATTAIAVVTVATMLWYGRISWWYAVIALLAGEATLWATRKLSARVARLPAIAGQT